MVGSTLSDTERRLVVIIGASDIGNTASVYSVLKVSDSMVLVIEDTLSNSTCTAEHLPVITGQMLEEFSNAITAKDAAQNYKPEQVNGNLHYCYKKPLLRPPFACRRFQIQQPCWRRDRWKSLT